MLPPLQKKWPYPAHKEQSNGNLFGCQTQGTFQQKRNYPWKKPRSCPCCRSCNVSGHGSVEAVLDGYPQTFVQKINNDGKQVFFGILIQAVH
jgi:hypothetical protein